MMLVLAIDQRRARIMCANSPASSLTSLKVIRQPRENVGKTGSISYHTPKSAQDDNVRSIFSSTQEEDLMFMREVFSELLRMARIGHLASLSIFADPQIMRLLRLEMPSTLLEKLLFVHDANITFLTQRELEQLILRELRERQ